jgi:hypothetical protein
MSKLSLPSVTVLKVGSFVITLIWAYMGLMAAEYLLVNFFQRIGAWIVTSFILELSMLIAILSICWWVKSRWDMVDSQWRFSTEEIEMQQLEKMFDEYLGVYSWLINHHFLERILLMIILFIVGLLVPFLTYPIGIYVFSYSPVVYTLVLIGLGIFSVRAIYPSIPSSVSDEFSLPSLSKMKQPLGILNNIDSISWSGVKVKIGEFDGYYKIADAQPVGRIRGFESVLRVEFFEEGEDYYESIRVIDLSEVGDDQEGKVLVENNSTSLGSIQQIIKISIASFSESHEYDEDTMEFFQELQKYSENNEPS